MAVLIFIGGVGLPAFGVNTETVVRSVRRGPVNEKLNAGNLLAGARSNTLIAGLFVVLIVSIVLLFANFAYINTQSGYDKEYISHAGELRVLSQRIAKNATEAAAGTRRSLLVAAMRATTSARWGYLTDGNEAGLPAAPEPVQAADG